MGISKLLTIYTSAWRKKEWTGGKISATIKFFFGENFYKQKVSTPLRVHVDILVNGNIDLV